MLEFNSQVATDDCHDPRGPQYVQQRIATILQMLGVDDAGAGRSKLEALIARIGCPTTLHEIGIVDDAEVRRLVAEVNAERLSNNPRRISAAQLFELLSPAISM